MENEYKELEKKKLLKSLETSMSGLKTTEAKARLKKYGKNELPKEKKKTIVEIFFGSMKDPIIYVFD